jgi:hypothetical protein
MSKARDLADSVAAGSVLADGVVSVSEITSASGANLNFVDNSKAIFGAGSDLQIYHNGSNSLIEETGTGALIIRSNSFALQNAAGNETIASMSENGAVSLFFDNAAKLATTSTGIDVTGTVVADGLTVDGLVKSDTASNGFRVLKGSGAYYGELSVDYISNDVFTYVDSIAGASYNGIVKIRTANNGGSVADRVRISSSGVSFYEDTGTTPKFFWDASAEALGIGTSSPAQAKLDILLESDYSSHTGHGLSILSNAANAYTSLYIGTDDTIDSAYIQSAGKNTSFTSKKLLLNPNGGNVGIGTSSPPSYGSTFTVVQASNSGSGVLQAQNTTNSVITEIESEGTRGAVGTRTNHDLAFKTNQTVRMRLDSSGNLGLGVTPNPATFRTFAIGSGGNVGSLVEDVTYNDLGIGSNVYFDSTWKYVKAGEAASLFRMYGYGGTFLWQRAGVAASAGDTISWSTPMTLDGSGNLLVGTTSLPTGGGILTAYSSAAETKVSIVNTGASGRHYWIGSTNTSSGAVGGGKLAIYDQTGNATRLAIDSSGNVGIGLSSPAAKFQIELSGTASLAAATIVKTTDFGANSSAGFGSLANNSDGIYFGMGAHGTGIPAGFGFFREASGWNSALAFYTNNITSGPNGTAAMQEKMRIDSAGNLNIGNSGNFGGRVSLAFNPATQHGIILAVSSGTFTNNYIAFQNSGGSKIGSISSNNSTVAYNTSSDYRLKEDWVAVADASTRVNALKPINFAWKATGERVDGFLAHELAEVVPEAVSGAKDAMRDVEYEVTPAVLDDEGAVVTPAVMGTRSVPDYQGIDQSKLVPLLTAALQEALAQIESLTARVSALEGN